MASSAAEKTTATKIAPARGKLGVMIVGMGAVATTFVAGVEAIRKGIAKPIGSLTQMGTIRLGKRTDNRSPKINKFVPLANLKDLVFTAWDIFEEDAYAAAMNAGVLEKDLLNQIKPFMKSIKPRKAVFDRNYVKLDKRRFRANVYVDLASAGGFAENEFVGRTLRIGAKAVIAVVDRDPRCKMITLDPDSAQANPDVMKTLARTHESKAGVYAAVLVEGTIRAGDDIAQLD